MQFTTTDGRFNVTLVQHSHRVDFAIFDNHCVTETSDISGWMKWDGCMDWTTDDCYFHFCDLDDVMSFSVLFKEIRERCIKLGCSEASFAVE